MKQGLNALASLLTAPLQMTRSIVSRMFIFQDFKSPWMTSSHVFQRWPLPRFPTTSELRQWLIQPSLRKTCPSYLKIFPNTCRGNLQIAYQKTSHYIQSNLYKTTTVGTTQKWTSSTCGRLIKHLYKTTTNQICRSWQTFSFYSQCEWFINKKDLLEQRFAILCVSRILSYCWF